MKLFLALLCICASAVLANVISTNKAVKVNDCTCYEKGNFYSPDSSNGCKSFSQRTAWLAPKTHNCPKGLMFDVETCVCNWPRDTTCATSCSYARPPKPSEYCEENGNYYAPVAGSNCANFTQATDVHPPVQHSCPDGLMFDLDTCVCNWPMNTTCTV